MFDSRLWPLPASPICSATLFKILRSEWPSHFQGERERREKVPTSTGEGQIQLVSQGKESSPQGIFDLKILRGSKRDCLHCSSYPVCSPLTLFSVQKKNDSFKQTFMWTLFLVWKVFAFNVCVWECELRSVAGGGRHPDIPAAAAQWQSKASSTAYDELLPGPKFYLLSDNQLQWGSAVLLSSQGSFGCTLHSVSCPPTEELSFSFSSFHHSIASGARHLAKPV